MKKHQMYLFNFAGQTLKGEYLGEFKLNDNSKIFKFKDKNDYIYSIKKENVCGNLKQ